MLEQVIADCQAALQAKTAECERNHSVIEQLRKELLHKQEQINVPKTEVKVVEKPREKLLQKQEQPKKVSMFGYPQ